MKIEGNVTQKTEYTLTLDVEAAQWLRGIMQNNLFKDESFEEGQMREGYILHIDTATGSRVMLTIGDTVKYTGGIYRDVGDNPTYHLWTGTIYTISSLRVSPASGHNLVKLTGVSGLWFDELLFQAVEV